MTSPIFFYQTNITRAIPVITKDVTKRAVFEPNQENCNHGSTCRTVLYLYRGGGNPVLYSFGSMDSAEEGRR